MNYSAAPLSKLAVFNQEFPLMKYLLPLAVFFASLFGAVHAEESEEIQQLREALKKTMPDLPINSIAESPIPGLLELVTGAQVYYITPNGKYVIEGNIIDVERRIDMTQQRKGKTQVKAINDIGNSKMVVYEPVTGVTQDREITVFTDATCGYCRKLHNEIDGLLSQGVRVRYLLYPRAGTESEAARILESVWCADDPQQAMTRAKSGQSVSPRNCENPIDEHIAMARQVGLQGTPMIFLDNGLVVPGYRPPDELIRLLVSEPRI
ncbi:MAG: DsbC family protein [Pseudomonadota bacterium]